MCANGVRNDRLFEEYDQNDKRKQSCYGVLCAINDLIVAVFSKMKAIDP